MKKSIFIFVLTGTLLLLFTGCATIISGSKQTVKFYSTPSSASVFINGMEVGKTPFETRLLRKNDHNIMIKLDGYKTYETSLTKKFNAWYLGNVLIGGLIGLILDPITGAMYQLTPKEINAELNKKNAALKTNKNNIYIAVALEINPNWKKVGQLDRVVVANKK